MDFHKLNDSSDSDGLLLLELWLILLKDTELCQD